MSQARRVALSAVVCLASIAGHGAVTSSSQLQPSGAVTGAPRAAPAAMVHAASAASSAAAVVASGRSASGCARLSPGARVVDTRSGPVHVAIPEGATTCSSIFVALHGAGSSVLGVCGRLAPLAASSARGEAPAVMFCPTGNLPHADGYADWQGEPETRAQHVDRALGAAATSLGLDASRPVALLAGFSRGGFLARDLAYLRPGRYERLLVVGAAFVPDVARWRASGVRAAVFAAPDLDGAAKTMRSAALRTAARGLPARFVSLGRGWHDLPEDSAARLTEHARWALSLGAPTHGT